MDELFSQDATGAADNQHSVLSALLAEILKLYICCPAAASVSHSFKGDVTDRGDSTYTTASQEGVAAEITARLTACLTK